MDDCATMDLLVVGSVCLFVSKAPNHTEQISKVVHGWMGGYRSETCDFQIPVFAHKVRVYDHELVS